MRKKPVSARIARGQGFSFLCRKQETAGTDFLHESNFYNV